MSKVISVVCTLSVAFVFLAHQPAPPSSVSPDLSAYTLPDGSTPYICLAGDHSAPDDPAPSLHCEFCRLVSATALPEPVADIVLEAGAWLHVHYAPGDTGFVQQAARPGNQTRAPPPATTFL